MKDLNHVLSLLLHSIGLVRAAADLTLTTFVQPIGLAPNIVAADTFAQTSGWGSNQPNKGPDVNILQWRSIQVRNCAANTFFPHLTQHLCTDAAICTSDIGGPLVWNNLLIGVSSWHHPEVCAAAANQDVYVRISTFRTWIMANID
jgi:hypothetical protein